MNLREPGGRPLVIGHRGAAAVAPENTLEGLAAAVAAGADLVEFDVDAGRGGAELLVAHPGIEPAEAPLTFDAALAYLATQEIGVHVDLKLVGAEREVVAALRRHALEERTVVSSTWARSLRSLAALSPGLARAVSYPRDRYGAAAIPWPPRVVRVSATVLRVAMRLRAPLLLAAARADALSLHHALVSPAVVRAAHARGAAVIAWTVNDPARIAQLAGARVDAIVSDHPEMATAVLATLEAPETAELETKENRDH